MLSGDKAKTDMEMKSELHMTLPITTRDLMNRRDVALRTELRGPVARLLRRVYGRAVAEPLPEKFRVLLDKLDGSEHDKR